MMVFAIKPTSVNKTANQFKCCTNYLTWNLCTVTSLNDQVILDTLNYYWSDALLKLSKTHSATIQYKILEGENVGKTVHNKNRQKYFGEIPKSSKHLKW